MSLWLSLWDCELWHQFILILYPLILPFIHYCLGFPPSLWRLLIRVLYGSFFRINIPPSSSPPMRVLPLAVCVWLNRKIEVQQVNSIYV